MPTAGSFTVPGILLPADTTSNRPAAADVVNGTLFPSTDDLIIYQSDGVSAWTAWATITGTPLNPGTYPDISDPGSPPGAGNSFVYSKAGRIYSMDSSGTVFGPFDVTGGGGTLYVYDETFPGSSLPGGWTFTGSGSCVVAAGVATVTSTAQSDRVMFAYTPPTNGISIIRAHLQTLSGEGGMPSLVALDSSGNGLGTGPYNDGSWYGWTANGTAYQYSGTNVTVGSSPSFPNIADVWASLLIIDGNIVGGGFSTDGASWTALNFLAVTQFSITQVGICQLFNSANMVVSLAELTITEP